MSMAVSHDCSFALTVSADHIIGQYKLFVSVFIAMFDSVYSWYGRSPRENNSQSKGQNMLGMEELNYAPMGECVSWEDGMESK